jgi:hypothetical protein
MRRFIQASFEAAPQEAIQLAESVDRDRAAFIKHAVLWLPAASERSIHLHEGQELAELGLCDSSVGDGHVARPTRLTWRWPCLTGEVRMT